MSLSKPNKPYYVKTSKVQYWFKRINKKVFNNSVAEPRNIILQEKYKWEWGWCITSGNESSFWWDLHMLQKYPSFTLFLEVLAHEMVHAWEYTSYPDSYITSKVSHGKEFFSWKEPLGEIGIHLSKYAYEQPKSDPTKIQESI